MSALHLVVRPRPDSASSPSLAPTYGLLDLIVDGINVTARIGPGQALALLAELGHAVASLSSGRRDRAVVQMYTDSEAWELGLEADGPDALITVYRCGAEPEVAVHERRVALAALRAGVLDAIATACESATGNDPAAPLASARRALAASWPPATRPTAKRVAECVTATTSAGLAVTARGQFRRPAEAGGCPAERWDSRLERADLLSLLIRAQCEFSVRGRAVKLGELHPFLLAEQLLALATEVVDAWQQDRPVFRRVQIAGARVGVRRGPGDVNLHLSLGNPELPCSTPGLVFPEIAPTAFVECACGFSNALADAFIRQDRSQSSNLRLTAMRKASAALTERLGGARRDDSLTNPDPDSYRSFGWGRAPSHGHGKWSHGGKMKFVPRWVATVPNIDLRATLLCGDHIIVSAARETACVLRGTGQVLWRRTTQPATCVGTPVGIVRIHPEGRVDLHDTRTGAVRFTATVMPRLGGGATGAVVYAPGLPKLLVLTEGDRQVTAIDLVSGDVRWRYTTGQAGAYRVRRGGKLLLVAGEDSALVALNAGTGEVVWRLRTRSPRWSAVTVDQDDAYAIGGAPSSPRTLHQLDLWSGRLKWSAQLHHSHASGVAPLVTSPVVVVPTRDRRGSGACAFDRATGALAWTHAPGLTSPTTAWLAAADSVVANSAAGALTAIAAATGTVRYRHVFSRHVDADQPRRLEPVLCNGALFVPQHQMIVVRPHDGEIIGTAPTDLIPDLLRVDERCGIYIAEESGHLAAFDVAPRLTLVR